MKCETVSDMTCCQMHTAAHDRIRETDKDSPHRAEIVCADTECHEHIKWATEQAVVSNEAEASNALLCPLMSGMVIVPATSEVRPARLRFEGIACHKGQCVWYVKVNEGCSIPEIAMSLGTIADWRLHDAAE